MAFVIHTVQALVTTLGLLGTTRIVVGATENQLMKFGDEIGYDDLQAYLSQSDKQKRKKYFVRVVNYFKHNKVSHGVMFCIKAPIDTAILKIVADNKLVQKLFDLLREVGSYVSEVCKRNVNQLKKIGEHIYDNFGTYLKKFETLKEMFWEAMAALGIGAIAATQWQHIKNGLSGIFRSVCNIIAAVFSIFCECAGIFFEWLTWEAHKYFFFVLGSMDSLCDKIRQASGIGVPANHESFVVRVAFNLMTH
eukprot:17566_1